MKKILIYSFISICLSGWLLVKWPSDDVSETIFLRCIFTAGLLIFIISVLILFFESQAEEIEEYAQATTKENEDEEEDII